MTAARGGTRHRRAQPPRDDDFGLECWHGLAPHMSRAHRHEHLEVNLVTEGGVSYLLGGHRFAVAADTTTVFWAGLPHQLVDVTPGTTMHWLHLPLGMVLSWGLPEPIVTRLLSGRPVVTGAGGGDSAEASGTRTDTADERDPAADRAVFRQWARDIGSGDSDLRAVALLEIEARIRRLARADLDGRRRTPDAASPPPVAAPGGSSSATARESAGADSVSRAARMAQFIATRFREPLTVEDVARSVHLNPHYAMTLFRQVVGQTVGSYLTHCRVAEAQRLLITSDATMPEVAEGAGFGSLSRFYASFADTCGQSPGAYRRNHVVSAS